MRTIMNSIKYVLVSVTLIVCSVSLTFAQAVGDYGSAATGTWGTTGANWLVCQSAGTWAGATAAPGAPTTTTNVWVRAGHTVTVEASGKQCANLAVEATAFLVGNVNLPTGTIQYLKVNGTTATINGVFGSSLSPGTNLALEAATTGGTLTISGSGTFGPARVRVSSDASNATIVFDMNATFRYTGSGGTGGVALYPQTDGNVFTVNAGKTLTFVVNASLAAGGSNRVSASVDLTVNVYGAINMVSSTSPLTLKATAGKTITLTVYTGGSLTVGGGIHSSTVADGGTTVMTVNGSLTAGGPVDFSNPSFEVTGTGTFTLAAAGNLLIGHPQGIASSGASGQIRTTTRTFNTAAKYSYVGTAAQITGTGLPAAVGDLMINNTAGVTMNGAVTVSDSLILTDGNVLTGANTLAMASTGRVDRTNGHVVGKLQKNVATGAGVSRTFEIGTAANYVPTTVTFANVSTAGNLVVSTTAGDHPNLASGNIDVTKSVNRYWTMANSGIVFDAYDAIFNFVSSELDPGASPGVFIVERYSGAVWSGLTEGTRASTSTGILGATAFGDCAIGEDETAVPAPAFELSASGFSLGAVRIGNSRADSAYVRNIGNATLSLSSVVSSNTPAFTVTPASASIPMHDSVKIRVTFTPSVTGASQTNIAFTHNAAGSPDTLVASGFGTVGAVRSNGTGGGNWQLAGTWQGGIIPTGFDSVIVRGSDSVSVTADTSCVALTLESGGRLGLFATLRADGATIGGNVAAQSNGRFNVLDTCTFENNAAYEHARNSGSLPTHALWLAGSTVRFTGIIDTVADNSSQSFYHVVWNCPGQVGNLNTDWDSIAIGGNISILNTGASGRWNMAGPVTNDSSTVTIMGNIFQSAGSFTSNGTGNAGTRITVHQYGNISVTGGNFSVSRGSQGGTGTTRWYLHGGDFSMANATTQNSNPANAWFVFAKPGTQILALGTGNTLTALPFEVGSGTTLNPGTSAVRGSGLITVDSGATIRSASTGGFDSTFAATGTRTLNPGSNYILDGSVFQTSGRRMADTLHNLTIANAAGVLLSDSILVNGTLALTSGDLDLNGKLITLGPSGLLSETAGNTVKGTSGLITTTRSLNAPAVGTDIAGLGVGIGSAANLGSTVISRGHGVQTVSGSLGIARYFDIVPSNNSGLNAALRFHYDDAELGSVGEPTLQLHQSTNGGSTWSATGGSLNTTTNRIEVTGQNSLARWTAAGDFCVNFSLTAGWNMISNPVVSPNDSVRQLYPTSTFNYAFGFNPGVGYQQHYRLQNGLGYWGKFPAGPGQFICGGPLTLDTIDVSAGWNMIGSISIPIDTGAIVQIPPGTVTSKYFGYSLGYNEASSLTPGKGYWVKAGSTGKLVLSGSLAAKAIAQAKDALEGFSSVTITDNTGASQTLRLGTTFAAPAALELFELPPQGPEGAFDVRFTSGRSVELVASGQSSKHPVSISSAAFPVTISWKIAGTLKLTAQAGEGEERELSGEGEWTITAPGLTRLTITSLGVDVPKEFSLGQNYPNLPVQSQLTLKVYNLLGQKVADVADGLYAAGYHELLWSGADVSSGVYFYRLEAISAVDGQKFLEVRKMILMK
jgi:hypothetical protein